MDYLDDFRPPRNWNEALRNYLIQAQYPYSLKSEIGLMIHVDADTLGRITTLDFNKDAQLVPSWGRVIHHYG